MAKYAKKSHFSDKNPFGLGETPPPFGKIGKKKSEFFLIMIFWIGRDPPARLSEKSKKIPVFYIDVSPYSHT